MYKIFYTKIITSFLILIGLALGVFLVQKAVHYFSGASGLPANLIVDLYTSNNKKTDVWRNLAQGGESKERMLPLVIPQVKALRPEYIRIDHIFDYYDQNMLDLVIRDIEATGAKPFIALSYMPVSLSKNGDVTDLPKNWTFWEDKVRDLIQHVSGRNGLAISNVYYEVWNEPDLFGKFKIGGDKNYLDLYLHSARGATYASNTLPYKFGGPATTGYYSNWMKGLLDYTSKNNLRLDFLSWHKYSKNLTDFETDVANARGLFANYNLDNKEMIITEIGPNGDSDPVYDNSFGAIHTIATSVVLQDEVDRTFIFEIKDGVGSKQYWGRWGLYTNEKFGAPIAKPRAAALTFLNNMIGGTKLNIYGQGSFVRAMAKKISPTVTRVLVVNYDPKGVNTESVPIKLANLSFSNFTFKRIDFLGTSTSMDVATTSATWSTTAYMKPNSASMFEVVGK